MNPCRARRSRRGGRRAACKRRSGSVAPLLVPRARLSCPAVSSLFPPVLLARGGGGGCRKSCYHGMLSLCLKPSSWRTNRIFCLSLALSRSLSLSFSLSPFLSPSLSHLVCLSHTLFREPFLRPPLLQDSGTASPSESAASPGLARYAFSLTPAGRPADRAFSRRAPAPLPVQHTLSPGSVRPVSRP